MRINMLRSTAEAVAAPAPGHQPLAPLTPVHDTAVAASGVSKRYGEGDFAVDAVRGVTLDVPSGQFTAVMGPSGSGKSTLMHMLAGLDQPTAGRVVIGGQDITRMDDGELTMLRRKHVGFVFQAFNLLPMLSAEENVVLPMSIAGEKVDRRWVESVFAKVGLSDRRDHRPSQLSGGQQQRVAIARALAAEPTVLLADEPTGNLDSTSSAQVLGLLREAVDSYGQTTLMVTHDAAAAAVADRVLFLADGLVVNDLDRPDESAILGAMKELS
jgi:putative ABC transport system ATP-binding protein